MYAAAAPRKSMAAIDLGKKRRGSTSFASVGERKQEGNVSLAPML